MKNLICFIVFCFTALLLHAQPLPPSALQTGIGLSTYTREKAQTPSILVAFKKDFIPSTVLEVSGEHALISDYNLESEIGKIQSIRFGLSLLYKVVEERKQLLFAGFGFSAGLYDQDYIEDSSIFSTRTQRTDLSPGFVIIAEYHYVLPNNLFFGGRANAFRYDEDRRGWNIGLVGGLRF